MFPADMARFVCCIVFLMTFECATLQKLRRESISDWSSSSPDDQHGWGALYLRIDFGCRWRERPETINAPEAHRTELSADENSSKKGRSWVSKSCNVARPHDQVQFFRNALDHPQEFPWAESSIMLHACQ